MLFLLAVQPEITHAQVDANADPNCVTQVRVPFRYGDLNGIKSVPVCTEKGDCYLTYEFDAIEDKLFNSIRANLTGQLVLNYTFDRRAPELVKFTSFNLDNGTFRLLFNEVCHSLLVVCVTLLIDTCCIVEIPV